MSNKIQKDTFTNAEHIINTGHTYENKQDIIQDAKKGRHMHHIQKYVLHLLYTKPKQTKKGTL
jgi:hypothetical protein